MTQEQEHQIVGRVTAEYQHASRECELLRIELEKIGKTLIDVGQKLIEAPAEPRAFGASEPFLQSIDDYSTQLRDAIVRKRRAREQLQALGVHLADD